MSTPSILYGDPRALHYLEPNTNPSRSSERALNSSTVNNENIPNGSEPKGLLKGSLTELESFPCELSVFFLESESLPDGLNGSELKKLSVEL